MTPKDMLTNPYFCPMPWTGLMYNHDGTVKNCIRSNGPIGNIKDHSIQDIVLGTTNTQTQQLITERKPEQRCDPCYQLEHRRSFDIVSDRVFYLRELKSVDPATYQVGSHDLRTIDVRWTNLCNFACVYCSPEYSSRWADEIGVLSQTPTVQQREDFKQYIFDRADQLHHVYLAGGEPLLMKENIELLDLLLQRNPSVNLRINSNLSKTDTNMFERVCEFQNVHWVVSIETLEQQFEYIRFGSRWADFVENLHTIHQLDHKISFNMLYFLLNSESVFDCILWLQGQGFHNNSFILGALTGPKYFDVRNLPAPQLIQAQQKIQSWLNTTPGFLLENGLRNILNYIQQPFEADFAASLAALAELDQRRGLNNRQLFPELYQ